MNYIKEEARFVTIDALKMITRFSSEFWEDLGEWVGTENRITTRVNQIPVTCFYPEQMTGLANILCQHKLSTDGRCFSRVNVSPFRILNEKVDQGYHPFMTPQVVAHNLVKIFLGVLGFRTPETPETPIETPGVSGRYRTLMARPALRYLNRSGSFEGFGLSFRAELPLNNPVTVTEEGTSISFSNTTEEDMNLEERDWLQLGQSWFAKADPKPCSYWEIYFPQTAAPWM
jgi:hypothetical protein